MQQFLSKMEKNVLEATLQERKRQEINQLKELRKERAKTSVSANFSGKQKKQQLRARKQRLNARRDDATQLQNSNEYESFYIEQDGDAESQIISNDVTFEAFQEQPDFYSKNGIGSDIQSRLKLTVALGKNNKDAVGKELSSFFVKETKEQIHLRLMEGQRPLNITKRNEPLRAMEILRDAVLDHPKRPKWTYAMTKKKVDDNESIMFDRWLTKIHNKYEHEDLNHFEHNLEVWRELWRVTERATHIVVVVDIRNPLLHIPPSIYDLAVKELHKPMIIVLNKVDLVPHALVRMWLEYLQQRFPACSFVCFSSRSQAVHGESNISSRRKALSKKLEVGDVSAIRGAAQILTACGVSHAEAEELVRELNTGLEELSLCEDTANSQPKRRSRRKLKKKTAMEVEESVGGPVVMPCQHCGGDEALFSCSTCAEERVGVSTSSGYLLCHRCESEEHAEAPGHAMIRIREANAAEDEQKNTSRAPSVTIGLLGHPNVGKSSVLNALAGKKIVSVSHTPGHTKRLQSILISKEICICDCPGLVFPFTGVPKYLQELCGLYPYSQIREPYSAVRFLAEHVALEKILELKPRTQLFDGMAEELEWNPWTICEAFAEKRGYRTDRRGRPDHQRAGCELVRDTVDGIVPLYFYPPTFTELKQRKCIKNRGAQSDVDGCVRTDAAADSGESDEEKRGQEAQKEEGDSARGTCGVTQKAVNAFSLLDDSSESTGDEE